MGAPNTLGQSARLGRARRSSAGRPRRTPAGRRPLPRRPPVLADDQLARLAGSRFAQVVQLAETTSTNSVLVGNAEGGAPEGMVVVADYQTAGRGRFERRWESPPGKSLLFSVLLRPSDARAAAGPPPPSCRGGVAGAGRSGARCRQRRGPAQVAERPRRSATGKVAGVLAEATSDGAIVVGAGVNVAWAPEPLERSGAPAATCLDAVAGRPVQRGELLVSALLALDRLYGHWDLVSRLYRETAPPSGARSRSALRATILTLSVPRSQSTRTGAWW